MKKMVDEKYVGSTVIRDDDRGIVLRNSSGGIEKVSNEQAHQYNSGSAQRAQRAHMSDLAAQAKENVKAENEVNRMQKQDKVDDVSAGVAAKRAHLKRENDFATGYKV